MFCKSALIVNIGALNSSYNKLPAKRVLEVPKKLFFMKSPQTNFAWKQVDDFFMRSFLEVNSLVAQNPQTRDKRFAVLGDGLISPYIIFRNGGNSVTIIDKFGSKSFCFGCPEDLIILQKHEAPDTFTIKSKKLDISRELSNMIIFPEAQTFYAKLLAPLSDTVLDQEIIQGVLKDIVANTRFDFCFYKPLDAIDKFIGVGRDNSHGDLITIELQKLI